MNKAGNPCGGYAVTGSTYCLTHSDPERASEIRAQAVEASVEARQRRVSEREEALEASKLTLSQQIALEAGRRAPEIAKAIVAYAIENPQSTAVGHVLDRTDGKVTESHTFEQKDPFSMSEADLHRWLTTAEPEPAENTQDASPPLPS